MVKSLTRERRLRLAQYLEAEALAKKLPAMRVREYLDWLAIPEWIAPALAATRRTGAEPDEVLPERSEDAEVRAWLRVFVARASLGRQLLVASGIERFPWLSCEARSSGWLDELIDAKGYGPTVVSRDRGALVVFYQEEHEYQAFLARQD
ncbi:hypothetical protein [Herbihabitans rhizosphaerae]|uniref:hypothetical protein n=1 Tax=Herbihabitans rhizosphaerae TaxID=1872711 RepID=UPI00102B0456|nr:hypothetical protein [Herbihabitans rhizosphaerae]